MATSGVPLRETLAEEPLEFQGVHQRCARPQAPRPGVGSPNAPCPSHLESRLTF